MAKTRIDELNLINEDGKSTEYLTEEAVRQVLKEYFEPMGIDEEQKEARQDLAYDLYLLFFSIFATMQAQMLNEAEIDADYFANAVSVGLFNEVYKHANNLENDANIPIYIPMIASKIIQTTINNIDSEYWTSQDRSITVAETQALIYMATDDFDGALAEGYVYKTWCTFGDNRVRNSHRNLEGTTIPIEEPFVTDDGSELMYPCDISLGASDNEIVGCRCWLEYS